MVDKPTRVNNVLDLFLTTHPSLVEKSTVLPGLSDHDGIPFIVVNTKARKHGKIKQQRRKIYIFKKADVDKLKSRITALTDKISGNDEKQDYPAASLWSDFKDGLVDAMDKSIPSKSVTKKGSNRRRSPMTSRDYTKESREPSTDS